MKVLYIAGWGRSGTTILDNILGSYRSVFSAGELFYLWRRGLNQGRLCGCGSQVGHCGLWREILEKAYAGRRLNARHTAALQRRVLRVRQTLSLTRGELSGEAAEYRDEMRRIYQAIADVTGAELVVDSSKVPSAAAVLARIPEVESYLVQMVRDPRAVAHSWGRRKVLTDVKVSRPMEPHGVVESGAHWLTWNLMIEQVARSGFGDRTRLLRYEDFVDRPRATVESLLRFSGIEPVGGPFRRGDDATVELAVNHTFSGNPGRFRTGEITLRLDDAWRAEQAWQPRLVSTALALPLLHRYGYPVNA